VTLAAFLSLFAAVRAADAQPFYAGKTIEIIVPLGPGGQMDIATRVLANYLQRFIEGNPSVQVVNLTGGGGILGANQFELNRKHDGLHFLMTGTATVFDYVLGRSAVKYDFKKIHPLWAAPAPSIAFFPTDTGIKSVKDLRNPAKPIVSGVVAPTGPELPTYMVLEMAGLLKDIRVVQGYKSGGDVQAAFLAGEINFGRNSHGSFEQRFGEQLKAGKITPVYTHGFYANGKYENDPKRPDLPNLEGAYEILTGKKPSGDFWDAAMLVNEINVSGGVNFGMHLDAPEEARKAMDKAIAAMVQDPQFKADMGKIFGEEYPSLSGPALVAAHKKMNNPDPKLVKVVQDFLVEKFKYKFD
jgi:tripartite-type tricarboxylate transporter receptor subunit TctC